MSGPWELPNAREPDLPTLAGLVAFALRPGDTVTLQGDLGAGKTTFARALIRSLLADPDAEVPSPTFSLVQTYQTPRLLLAHADLYRLSDAAELTELGLDDTLARGAVLIEWPERASGALSADHLTIAFEAGADPASRRITFSAGPSWTVRLDRIRSSYELIEHSTHLHGAMPG